LSYQDPLHSERGYAFSLWNNNLGYQGILELKANDGRIKYNCSVIPISGLKWNVLWPDW
jgi:hypothetical protein